MPVTINGNGSITGLAQGGIDGTKVVTAAAQPAGSVIQRVQNLTHTRAAISNTTFTATAHSVTITPTLASSKILINFSSMVNTNGTNFRAYIDVYRSINGGTFTGIAPQGSSNTTGSSTSAGFIAEVRGDNSRIQVPFNIHYLDSPSYSVGNAIVYKLYLRSSNSSHTVELPASNQNEPVVNMATEIAG